MTANTLKTFLTGDGVRLEVLGAVPENAKACLIVWPLHGRRGADVPGAGGEIYSSWLRLYPV
jgi:hypothetical protein